MRKRQGFDLAAAVGRKVGALDAATFGYRTQGGTYIIASEALGDDGAPHDLVAILPMALEGSRVVVLRPTVNPDLVGALRVALGEQDDDR